MDVVAANILGDCCRLGPTFTFFSFSFVFPLLFNNLTEATAMPVICIVFIPSYTVHLGAEKNIRS